MHKSSSLLLCVLLYTARSRRAAAQNNAIEVSDRSGDMEIGGCSLLGFLPFTKARGSSKTYPSYQLERPDAPSFAFTHLAAARLAADHFNARDNSVVPELPTLTANCNVRIPDLYFSDTEANTGGVAKSLLDYVSDAEKPPLCAVVGPYDNRGTINAGVIAAGLEIVVVSHGADDPRLSQPIHPEVIRTCMNAHSVAEAVVNFLKSRGRTDFLATIYTAAEFGVSYSETIDNGAKEAGFKSLSFHRIAAPFTGFEANRSIRYALADIKRSTYRTIVCAFHVLDRIADELADAAEEYGMLNGDYVWVFLAPVNVLMGDFAVQAMQNANSTKLFQGAAVIRVLDGFDYYTALGQKDAFLESWKQQNSSFADRVNALHPIQNRKKEGYYQAEADYFQKYQPQQGAGYMYDAVMAVAMGKCKEKEIGAIVTAGANSKRKSDLSPQMKGITSLAFTGATGYIVYNESSTHPRNRQRKFATFGAYNIRAISEADKKLNGNYTQWFYLTDILQGGPVSGAWTKTPDGPFLFADGTPNPPTLLRDIPNQNYISSGVQIFGLLLMTLSILFSFVTACLVFWHQDKQIIKGAQPFFLYILLLGTVIIAFSIFPISFDEGGGWNNSQLDSACVLFPWLLSLGYITIYCALFMKLWRINKLLQSRCRIVEAQQVLWPCLLLVLAAVVVLSVWTATDSFTWERDEINKETGESYGRCRSEHDVVYMSCLSAVCAISTSLSAYMAWKTKDVDERYSESSWMFYTIVLQMQVLIVGIPILIILNDESANATYLGRMLLIVTIPMSTILLMFGPKIATLWLTRNNVKNSNERAAVSANIPSSQSSESEPSQNRTALTSEAVNNRETVSSEVSVVTVTNSMSESTAATAFASSICEEDAYIESDYYEGSRDTNSNNNAIDKLQQMEKIEEGSTGERATTEVLREVEPSTYSLPSSKRGYGDENQTAEEESDEEKESISCFTSEEETLESDSVMTD